jgi:hypothetical protein
MRSIEEKIQDAVKSHNRRCEDRSDSGIETIHVLCDDLLRSWLNRQYESGGAAHIIIFDAIKIKCIVGKYQFNNETQIR